MKYIILTLVMLFANMSLAQECKDDISNEEAQESLEIKTDVPNHLKGATITVTLADGKTSTVPAEKFKVVPRLQQFIVTKTALVKVTTCTVNNKDKNRVAILGGVGPNGKLSKSYPASNTVEVSNETGAVGGLQYQRLLTDKFSIGVQGQTNQSGSLILGLDF